MKLRTIFISLIIELLLIFACVCLANQTQPDLKRVREIQAALILHGYEPGRGWAETRELLRRIARSHGWQTKHAPDARVLILLGLGNKNSDPAVLKNGKNHLDGGIE